MECPNSLFLPEPYHLQEPTPDCISYSGKISATDTAKRKVLSMDTRASYSGGRTRATYTTQPLSILLGRLPLGGWLCVPPPACPRKIRPSGRSACLYDMVALAADLRWSFSDLARPMKGGRSQQLVPGSVNTAHARNKKQLANPALQQTAMQRRVIFESQH